MKSNPALPRGSHIHLNCQHETNVIFIECPSTRPYYLVFLFFLSLSLLSYPRTASHIYPPHPPLISTSSSPTKLTNPICTKTLRDFLPSTIPNLLHQYPHQPTPIPTSNATKADPTLTPPTSTRNPPADSFHATSRPIALQTIPQSRMLLLHATASVSTENRTPSQKDAPTRAAQSRMPGPRRRGTAAAAAAAAPPFPFPEVTVGGPRLRPVPECKVRTKLRGAGRVGYR